MKTSVLSDVGRELRLSEEAKRARERPRVADLLPEVRSLDEIVERILNLAAQVEANLIGTPTGPPTTEPADTPSAPQPGGLMGDVYEVLVWIRRKMLATMEIVSRLRAEFPDDDRKTAVR